jgi:hypothetical protein
MIKTAAELVQPGQNAVVIFTHGDLFKHDTDGNGDSGNWVAAEISLEGIDRVIIYQRDNLTKINYIYVGDYEGWALSPEKGRKIIRFSRLKEVGQSSSLWPEFKGSGGSFPLAYIHK